MPEVGAGGGAGLRGGVVAAAIRLDLRLLPTWRLPVGAVVYVAIMVYAWLGGDWADFPDGTVARHPLLWLAILAVAPSLGVWATSVDRVRLLHGMLPLSWRDVLRARYTQFLVSLVVLFVLVVIAQVVSVDVHAPAVAVGPDARGWGVALGVWVLVALALVAVPPLVLMYGTGETGQWVLLGFIVVWAGLAGGVGVYAEGGGQPLVGSQEGLVALTVMVTVLGVVGLYGSWRLSLRLSSGQDL